MNDAGTVLIVDDDRMITELIKVYLESERYRVLVSFSGEEAVEAAPLVMPDIVLLDMNLEGINGIECLRLLQPMDCMQGVPVLFLSGLSDSSSKLEALRHGAVDFITKPFRKDELIIKVGNHIKVKHLHDQVVQRNEKLDRLTRQLQARIAEQEATETQLLAEQKKLSTILEFLPVGVFLIGPGGEVLECNKRSREIWGGVKFGDLEVTGSYKAWIPDTGQRIRPKDWAGYRAVANDETILFEQVDIEGFDGIRRNILNSAIPLHDAAGKVSGAIIVNEDISALKTIQKQLYELNATLETKVAERTAELERSNQEFEAFGSSVAHELRAPLRHIHGFAQLLVHGGHCADEDARQQVEAIINESVRMEGQMQNLYDYARVGHADFPMGPVDMDHLASAAFSELASRGDYGKITFCKPELSPCIGDKKSLYRVWLNLLGNALKYSAASGHPVVTLSSTMKDGYIEYRISDNGIGFDPAYADKLFGVFQRLHSGKRYAGTGIGLAIVKRIITRHGGCVSAEGKPGAGAVFRFLLPDHPIQPDEGVQPGERRLP
jgi:signal transduction histidine kinase/DNA-binding response OmpR family regulator